MIRKTRYVPKYLWGFASLVTAVLLFYMWCCHWSLKSSLESEESWDFPLRHSMWFLIELTFYPPFSVFAFSSSTFSITVYLHIHFSQLAWVIFLWSAHLYVQMALQQTSISLHTISSQTYTLWSFPFFLLPLWDQCQQFPWQYVLSHCLCLNGSNAKRSTSSVLALELRLVVWQADFRFSLGFSGLKIILHFVTSRMANFLWSIKGFENI